ncbi:hypothetical protein [Aliihoeflea sp. 2WW]|uniref:hypothetical protein n=1 Tax=Aliihoeflea sp. 2WW TaxID=1381123 RepID=UPI0004641A92|nr:hypothetical protein [Aliihoeflea sp. 2WW]
MFNYYCGGSLNCTIFAGGHCLSYPVQPLTHLSKTFSTSSGGYRDPVGNEDIDPIAFLARRRPDLTGRSELRRIVDQVDDEIADVIVRYRAQEFCIVCLDCEKFDRM